MNQINREIVASFFDKNESLYSSCVETMNRYGMKELIESGVIVGFSGGSDSVFLTLFLLEYRRRNSLDFPILSVHVNHGIRGSEALRDEDFCINFSRSLGLDIEVEHISVPKLAKESGESIEEAARNARYSVFKKKKQGRKDISSIAVAHNMSDNAETVLFNILRGGGAKGASGIPPVRDDIVRPLLKLSKNDIETSLIEFGIPFVHDSTNSSLEYTRNYIRHEIMPRLDKITANPENMLSRFSDTMREDDALITSFALDMINVDNAVLASQLSRANFSVYFKVLSILAEKVFGSVSFKIASDIRSLLDKKNFTYSITNAIFVCENGICTIRSQHPGFEDYLFPISIGSNSFESLGLDIILSNDNIDKNYLNVYNFSIKANLSSAIIYGSLFIRPKKDGDTIYYGGITHKLKKLFNDRKVSLTNRKKIPVLCDDKGVVWVPGFGVRDDGVLKENRKDLFILLGSYFDFFK